MSGLQRIGTRTLLMLAVAGAGMGLATERSALAASGTWLNTGSTDANWTTTTNWTGGTVPGAITGTTNGDTATFNSAIGTNNYGTVATPIVIDSSSENLKNVTFDTGAGAYTIGATGLNSLFLTSGGTIQNNAGVAATETINAPLVLEGSYTIQNGATNNAALLNIGGNISDAAAATLTLAGANTGTNTISGNISNGTAALGISKSGAGTWVLAGANTYTGATAIGGGTLTLTGSVGNTAITLSSGALNLNSTGALATGTSLTLNGGVLDNTSGAAINLTNSPAIILGVFAYSTAGGTANNNLNLGTGAVTMSADRTLTLNGAGTLTMGTLTNTDTANGHTLTVNNGTGTSSTTALTLGGFALTGTGSTGARVDGINGSATVNITGPITNGVSTGSGLTYSGSGTLNLSGTSTYTGATSISNGTVNLSGALGNTAISLSAGTLNLLGANAITQNTLTLTGGTLNIKNAGAFATAATLTLNGGVLDNASGAAMTLTNNPAISLGVFSYSTSAGTGNNNLNLGTGAVSMAADRILTLNGAGILTMGVLTNTDTTAGHTLTVNNGTGTSSTTALTLGGFALTGTGSAAARVDGINGSATVNITGPITNGISTGSGLTYSGTGTLNLSGASTYTGATTVSSGTVNLTGSLGNTAVTVNGGTFNPQTVNALSGSAALTVNGGTANLSVANNYSGATTLTTGTLQLSDPGAVASSALKLNGGTLKLLSDTNNTTFTTASTAFTSPTIFVDKASSATGNTLKLGNLTSTGGTVTLTNADAYNLAVGTVSASNGTTYTNNMVNGTFTMTSLADSAAYNTITFNGTSTTAITTVGAITGPAGNNNLVMSGLGTLQLTGANTYNGYNGTTISSGTVTVMTGASFGATGIALNGGTLNLNNASAISSSTLTCAGGTLAESVANAISGTGALKVTGGSVTLTQPNNYSGATTVTGGTLNVNNTLGASSISVSGGALNITANVGSAATTTTLTGGTLTLSGPNGALLGTGTITIGSGTLAINDTGVASSNGNRLPNSASITLNNAGALTYLGSDQNNSTETIGAITLGNGVSKITVSGSGTNTATVSTSSGSFTRTASSGGLGLINGTNLGTSGSAGQFLTATAPTLVGTTAGGSTGINSAKQDTKIALFLLGESGTATGQNGTANGTPNTFLTYNATTGYRPLNPTDEFTNNAITAATNTYLSSGTTLYPSGTAAINSLVVNGGNLSLASGNLTNTSGMLLFASSNTISGAGTLTLGGASNQESIVAVNAGFNATISAALATGSTGLTVYGPGTLTLAGTSTYTAPTTVLPGATLIVASSGALGASSITAAGGTIKGDGQPRTISNTLVDTASGMIVGGSSSLTFTGSGSNPAWTNNTYANTPVVVTNTGTTTISGVYSLNNSTSGSNNGGSILTMASSTNVVITGPIQDNNSGNVAASSTNWQASFSGAGANLTINPAANNNNYGATKSTFIVADGAYNTVTLGGSSATITPFGATQLGFNTGNTLYVAAANNGQVLGNNIFASGGSGFNVGFVGSNSMTLGGTWTNSEYGGGTFANLATGTFTFGNTLTTNTGGGLSSPQPQYFVGSGNTVFNSNATLNLAPAQFVVTQSGTTTFANANNDISITTFTGGTVVLDYSATSAGGGSNRLGQNIAITNNAAALTLAGVNLQLSGGSFAQTLGSGQTLALTTSGSTASGSSTITLASTTGIVVGTPISGTGIPSNDYITAVNTATGVITLFGATNAVIATGGALSSLQTGGTANGTTLNAGQSQITQTNSGTSTIALGAIARSNNNGGVINFGTGVASTTSAGANGILGGYATVTGTDWAVGGGTITALASGSYTALTNGTLTTTGNYYYTGSGGLSTSATAQTVYSLKMDASVDLTLGSTLTITTGGLLFTGTSPVSITGSTLQAANNTTDLIVQQYGSSALTINSVIGGGSNPLTKAGPGTLVLTNAANTYTGGTFLDQGVVRISADGNLGASGKTVTFNGGTLAVTGTGFTTSRTIALGTNGGTFQIDSGTLTLNSTAVISGTSYAGLNKTGAGTLLLQAADTFTGPVTVSAGTLQLGSATALGASSTGSNRSIAPILVNGGTLDINGQTTALGNVTLQSGTIADTAVTKGTLAAYSFTLQSGTVSAALTDLVISGNSSNSTNVYKTTSGTVTLSGASTYSGVTNITAGTLSISSLPNLGTGAINMAGGTLQVTGTALTSIDSRSVNWLAFSGGFDIAAAGNTFTAGQAIGGTGSLSKAGAGTLVLAGSSAYTGGTIINAGTLAINADSGLGNANSSVTINNGTLEATGSMTLSPARSIILGAGTPTIQVDAGTLTVAGTMATGNLTKTGAGILQFAPGTNNDLKSLTALTVSTGTVDMTNHDLLILHGLATNSLSHYLNTIITSTTVPANNGGNLTPVIALVSGSDYNAVTGNPILSNDDLYGRFTYAGDANLDGIITADDYVALNLGSIFNLRGWVHGDFAQTGGPVTPLDYALIDTSYLRQNGTLADSEIALHTQWFGAAYTDAFNALSTPAAVPEPASLALLGLGTLGLLKRRR